MLNGAAISTAAAGGPQGQSPAVLEARGVSAGYNGVAVVDHVDVHVRPGEVVALLGPNGAGKTTTIMTLSGAIALLGGSVSVNGEVTSVPLYRRARMGMSVVTEERSIFKGLTAAENLRVAGVSVEAAMEVFPEIGRFRSRRAGLLSGGEQQMVVLARALARRPQVLLADELSLGLAPMIVQRLLATLRSAADRGLGVLLVEQHVHQALEIADRVYVMRGGRIVLEGAAADMRNRTSDIEAAYLGGRSQ